MKCRIDAIAAAMVLALSIAGCGGSSNGTPAADANTTGIWTGAFVQGTNSFDIFALIADGQAKMLSRSAAGGAGLLYDGSVETSGNNFTGNLAAFSVGGSEQFTATLAGTLQEGESASGTFTPSAGAGAPGTFSLNYDPLNDRGSSLENISGTWLASEGENTLSIVIDSNGTLFGSDSVACTYNGTVTIVEAEINVYSIAASRSGACTSNGDYSGLAAVIDSDSENENDTLILIVSNATTNLVIEFTRASLIPV